MLKEKNLHKILVTKADAVKRRLLQDIVGKKTSSIAIDGEGTIQTPEASKDQGQVQSGRNLSYKVATAAHKLNC